MQLLRYFQHWLTGRGPCLQVVDRASRSWTSFRTHLPSATGRIRFRGRYWWRPSNALWPSTSPTPPTRGRPPVSTRVLLALELLKQELACSDEQICSRLRTDLAVMYACGIREVQLEGSQDHFVLPEVLAHFRSRLDAPLMAE